MERFDQDFADGLALDLFSPTNRTVVVNQNLQPLGGQFVTGSSGETFVALKNYSYVIKTSDNAMDLVAKIEVPYDLDMLNQMGLQESNTYVGKLADDKMSWTVDEATRNVHRSENNTRIIKMTSIDGEYILLGRQSIDTTNIFVQYGQGATRTVNVTAGGRQEAEFIDGLRFSVVAQQDMKINVDLKNGVDPASLPSGTQSLNPYSWVVNTTAASANVSATMKVPCTCITQNQAGKIPNKKMNSQSPSFGPSPPSRIYIQHYSVSRQAAAWYRIAFRSGMQYKTTSREWIS